MNLPQDSSDQIMRLIEVTNQGRQLEHGGKQVWRDYLVSLEAWLLNKPSQRGPPTIDTASRMEESKAAMASLAQLRGGARSEVKGNLE